MAIFGSKNVIFSLIRHAMPGGTEGVLTPHLTVFGKVMGSPPPPVGQKRLAVGVAFTRPFLPEEIGRVPQVRAGSEHSRLSHTRKRQAHLQPDLANHIYAETFRAGMINYIY